MYPCGGCGKTVETASVKINGKDRPIDVDMGGAPHHCPSDYTIEQHLKRIEDLLEKLVFEIHEGFRV